MASTRESAFAQDRFSDFSCVINFFILRNPPWNQSLLTRSSSMPGSEDLLDSTVEDPGHMKTAQCCLLYVKPLCGTIAANRDTVLYKSLLLSYGEPSFVTVIHQVESAHGESSKS